MEKADIRKNLTIRSQNTEAIVAGVGTDEDKSRLKALEEEAAQLRAVLADMEDKDENN